ncbi:MAG TPA: TRAP transporter small permease subunit [Usitatibacter sp.]|jgi:TRAP-type C4-dicarboxylate transport system permease small subunit
MGSALERSVAWIVRAASVLVLPVSLLLFLQWPLRDLVHSGSREANDLAQILFALYVSVALTAATRDGSHLAADVLARRYTGRLREWMWRAACLLIAIPAALFVLWTGSRGAWSSLLQLEHFPETMNPGYFLVRMAAVLLAALVLLQAVLDVAGVRRDQP